MQNIITGYYGQGSGNGNNPNEPIYFIIAVP